MPEDRFDFVISFAALAHLEKTNQCQVVVELAGKLRRGGKAWFGWNAPAVWGNTTWEALWMLPAQEAWRDCFRSSAKRSRRFALFVRSRV